MNRAEPLLIALALALVTAVAHAAPPVDTKHRAKAAYARGLRAHASGDFQGAATAFAEADALAPSPVALMAALDEATLCDDPVLGAELLERSARAEPTPALSASVEAARRKLGGRAGKLRVACPASATCRTTIDGRSAEGSTWVAVGRHTVVVRVDDAPPREQVVEVRGGETFVVSPLAPDAPDAPPPIPPAPPPGAPQASANVALVTPPPSVARISPVVVFVGAAATAVLGAGAAAGGILLGKAHDDFVADRCPEGPGPRCATLQAKGEQLVIATNVLLVGTVVAAVVTTVIAVAFTDWDADSRDRRGRPGSSKPVSVRPGGAGLVLEL
jgi:hypothetical protein